MIGFDLVEVDPMIDVASDNTSLLAVQLILEFLGRIVESPGYRARHPMKGVAVPELVGVKAGRNGKGGKNSKKK